MKTPTRALTAGLLWALFSAPVLAQDATLRAATAVQKVDGAFITANAAHTPDWPAIGVDYGETRFSRLDQLSTHNVKDLGLVWSYNLESTRGVEATPVVVDGVMYVTTSYNHVYALDAATGKEVWKARLPVGAVAAPLVYVSPKTGKQYVVISAGGARQSPDRGDYVIAYALPSAK